MLFSRYSPLELVVDVYLTPVSLFVAVIVAPGTVAPVLSVTTPTRMLSVVWALAVLVASVRTAKNAIANTKVLHKDVCVMNLA